MQNFVLQTKRRERVKFEDINIGELVECIKAEKPLIGNTFKNVLECAGVYKCNTNGRESFLKFIAYVNER